MTRRPSSPVGVFTDPLMDRLRLHPRILDAALAVLLSLVAVVDFLVPPDGPSAAVVPHAALAPLVDVAAALPLALRRRWPVPVFAVVLCVAAVQVFAEVPSRGFMAYLVALYSIGAQVQRRSILAVAVLATEFIGGAAILVWAPVAERTGAFVLLTGTVSAALVLGIYARTRRAYLISLLERAATAEREREHAAELAATTERSRIARELHDIVAHSLSVMIALTDGALFTLRPSPDDAQDALQQASRVGRQTMAEMRRLVGVLREAPGTQLTPQPSLLTLDELLAQVRSAGVPVELLITGQPPDIPASAQLALYRIIQESLTNVLKHAKGATGAKVALRYDHATVELDVTDDGILTPVSSDRTTTGHGLTGMRERAAVFGGTVSSAAQPGRGWRVHASLDLRQRTERASVRK